MVFPCITIHWPCKDNPPGNRGWEEKLGQATNEKNGRAKLRNGQRNLTRISKHWPSMAKGGKYWWKAADHKGTLTTPPGVKGRMIHTIVLC